MDFGSTLSQYGLPGAIIFAMGLVIKYQAARIDNLTDKLLAQSEDRRTETLERETKVINVMSTFSQSAQMLVDKIVPVQRSDK